MAHQFESGMFVRQPAWHGLGTVVQSAPTTAEALRLAEMDWHVAKEPCYDKRNRLVPDTWLNVRDKDNAILGVIGNRYINAQPVDAMDFIDGLIGKDIELDTAISLFGGRRICLLAKAPARDILGDAIQPYVFVTTSFDGSSPTLAGTTITRIVCNNTLDMAKANATRRFTVRHTANLMDKLAEARRVMKLASSYVDSMAVKAEKYATYKLSKSEFLMATNELFGDEDLLQGKQLTNIKKLKEQFGVALRQPDLANFKGSAWHVFNAVGDFATHIDPVRKTATWQDNLVESFLDGNEYLIKAEKILDTLVA
jgi:phage/plasmid-like protein (TIGR03299 family)